MRNRGLQGSSGFTLLEMIVSLLILGIALTTIFRLQSMSVMMASNIQFETTAPLLAQKKMAEYMIKEAEDLASDSGDFGDDFPNYSWTATVEEMESEYLDTTAERLRVINISVSRTETSYSYDIQTYRFVEPQQ
ncbi:MAG: prepilin-type N-terminal cleavage/methylation domain-containing protein [Desulfatibacillum sp.]|nr:prepilin-type N-terminal cleavage/methylation domain-containing protein [Desulfatibacillum sp.]